VSCYNSAAGLRRRGNLRHPLSGCFIAWVGMPEAEVLDQGFNRVLCSFRASIYVRILHTRLANFHFFEMIWWFAVLLPGCRSRPQKENMELRESRKNIRCVARFEPGAFMTMRGAKVRHPSSPHCEIRTRSLREHKRSKSMTRLGALTELPPSLVN